MARSAAQKTLDKGKPDPYATPSMSSPLATDMWAGGPFYVHFWTERGDLTNGREEEGCEEGSEEEEVSAPGKKGGWTDHPPCFTRELTAPVAARSLRA
jgi:hypothetical protein